MSDRQTLEALYDQYSSMLYGIALQLCNNESQAEVILTKTFDVIFEKRLFRSDTSSICVTLLKELIVVARNELRTAPGSPLKLSAFENSPLLHLLLCTHCGLEMYCKDNGVSRADAMTRLKSELDKFRHVAE